MKQKLHLSVRELSEPIIRKGGLTQGFSALAMERGQILHERVQEQLGNEFEDYQKEKSLKIVFQHENFELSVSGRVDGYFEDSQLLEEIKTASNIDKLEKKILADDEHPYRLQALSYAYIYHETYDVVPKLRLRLLSRNSSSVKIIDLDFDPQQYKAWVEKKLDAIWELEEKRLANKKRRIELSKLVEFPFDKPRKGQLELVEELESNLEKHRQILLQAPTGLGKTMGVLLPALKQSLSRGEQLFYVTPKNSQFAAVSDAVKLISAKSAKVRTLFLTAKTKICPHTEQNCDEEKCSMAEGYYDKLHEKNVESHLRVKKVWDAKSVSAMMDKFEVCPYELSMEMLEWADVIVCDYNYVFNIDGALKPFLNLKSPENKPNLVIDEAHNLYERAIGYFSLSLNVHELKDYLINSEIDSVYLENLFDNVISMIEGCLGRGAKFAKCQEYPDLCYAIMERLFKAIIKLSDEGVELTTSHPLMELYFHVGSFQQAALIGDEKLSWIHNNESLDLLCANPAFYLKNQFKLFSKIIAFSATLKPFKFYINMSGLNKTIKTIEAETPFPKENRKLFCIPQISTLYRNRQRDLPRICDAINRISSIKKGNYFVFFPSYQFMTMAEKEFSKLGLNVWVQQRNLTNYQIDKIKKDISADTNKLFLAVQGGSLSEGLDINTEMLRGVFVVGPAIPRFSEKKEIQKRALDLEFSKGHDYTYLYPAMCRSIQSAGRVIRNPSKKGLICLMGARFIKDEYSEAMPSDWYEESVAELCHEGILSSVSDFWSDGQGSIDN